jgi:hypothetical protein
MKTRLEDLAQQIGDLICWLKDGILMEKGRGVDSLVDCRSFFRHANSTVLYCTLYIT